MISYLITFCILGGIGILELVINAFVPMKYTKAKTILAFISLSTMLLSLCLLFNVIKILN